MFRLAAEILGLSVVVSRGLTCNPKAGNAFQSDDLISKGCVVGCCWFFLVVLIFLGGKKIGAKAAPSYLQSPAIFGKDPNWRQVDRGSVQNR